MEGISAEELAWMEGQVGDTVEEDLDEEDLEGVFVAEKAACGCCRGYVYACTASACVNLGVCAECSLDDPELNPSEPGASRLGGAAPAFELLRGVVNPGSNGVGNGSSNAAGVGAAVDAGAWYGGMDAATAAAAAAAFGGMPLGGLGAAGLTGMGMGGMMGGAFPGMADASAAASQQGMMALFMQLAAASGSAAGALDPVSMGLAMAAAAQAGSYGMMAPAAAGWGGDVGMGGLDSALGMAELAAALMPSPSAMAPGYPGALGAEHEEASDAAPSHGADWGTFSASGGSSSASAAFVPGFSVKSSSSAAAVPPARASQKGPAAGESAAAAAPAALAAPPSPPPAPVPTVSEEEAKKLRGELTRARKALSALQKIEEKVKKLPVGFNPALKLTANELTQWKAKESITAAATAAEEACKAAGLRVA